MNYIHIAGHLGGDAETRVTPTGKKVTSFNVAVRTREAGNDDTIWFRVTIWDDDFKNLIPHLKKGSAVMVVGELRKPKIYTDRQGKPQASYEITAIHVQFSPFGKPGGASSTTTASAPESVSQSSSFSQAPQTSTMNPYMSGSPSAGPSGGTFDDEVPF